VVEPTEAGPTPLPRAAAGGQLLASLVVGGALGAGVDYALGWWPWGLLAGILLGFLAWLRELWKLLQTPSAAAAKAVDDVRERG
jgi:F0F1-type ATP synthase assembly protein I